MIIEDIKIGKSTTVTAYEGEYYPKETVFILEDGDKKIFLEVVEIEISILGEIRYTLLDTSYYHKISKIKDPRLVLEVSLRIATDEEKEIARKQKRFI